jgi:YidC/Oxa1 family membrane protein insertase
MNNRLKPYDPAETQRLMILMVLMGLGLLAYHYFYEYPIQRAAQLKAMEQQAKQEEQLKLLEKKQEKEAEIIAKKAEKLPKVRIKAPEMEGAILLQGGRINSLKLLGYKEEAKKDSPAVKLLHPQGSPHAYFIEFGWLSKDKSLALPDAKTLWKTKDSRLSPEKPLTLHWENKKGLRFEITFALKGEYLFEIAQQVKNTSGKAVKLIPYAYINRTMPQQATQNMILHEGPLGVMDGSLNEIPYHQMIEDKAFTQQNATGWLGITDKYWLTALIPQSGSYTGNFKAYPVGNEGAHRFQVDYMGSTQEVAAGNTLKVNTLLFAGAKKLALLEDYAAQYGIPLFDRAVDLGWLYFLTKPLLHLLHWLYVVAGDFGLAILLLTVCVKGAMYPLANKSYVSMNEMKKLQPKLTKLKEQCKDDKVKFNQEMMKLYKQEKINPASGCLPLFIQMPVFFALYKVLYVAIEMRHANFYGIIHDLSAPDPTNVFNAFGLLEWTPPSMLHLGILGIMFGASMWGTQQLGTKPTDPMQAKMMSWLPWVFMFIVAGFPAGLLMYWVWSNVLSTAQQTMIKLRYDKKVTKREAKLAAANDG